MLCSLVVDPEDTAIMQSWHRFKGFSGGAYVCLQNKSGPWPNGYIVIHMCSAVSDLSCYIIMYWQNMELEQEGVGWESLTTAVWVNLLFPYSGSEVAQSCLTLCDPMDWSPPGSSVHGILQARILEWGAISSSRGSSQPRDWTWVSYIAGRRFTLWATREAFSQKPYEMVILGMILLLRVSKTKYRFTNCALRQL